MIKKGDVSLRVKLDGKAGESHQVLQSILKLRVVSNQILNPKCLKKKILMAFNPILLMKTFLQVNLFLYSKYEFSWGVFYVNY